MRLDGISVGNSPKNESINVGSKFFFREGAVLTAKHMGQGDAEREMIFHSERPGALGLYEKDLRRYVYLRYGLIPGVPLGDKYLEP